MSFLNSPQYASVTTRLLEIADDVMPRWHQIILAAIVACITLGSIASTVLDWRARASAAPLPPIVIVATPTPGMAGLAKEAAPLVLLSAPTAMATSQPTSTPVEPTPWLVIETSQVSAPQGHEHERKSDKPGPVAEPTEAPAPAGGQP